MLLAANAEVLWRGPEGAVVADAMLEGDFFMRFCVLLWCRGKSMDV
jgi:hypothetical protein